LVIFSPDKKFFTTNTGDWLSNITRADRLLAGEDYRTWQRFREQNAADCLGVVMPDILLRGGYKDQRIGFLFVKTEIPRPGL